MMIPPRTPRRRAPKWVGSDGGQPLVRFFFQYSQAAISWASRKQDSVALSSCEAEIMALSEAAKEAAFLSRYLDELGLLPAGPMSLGTDNTGARNLAYNPEHHEKTKHIERRHFYVRELVESQTIVVPYVNTVENLADFFTKPLDGKHFFSLRNRIMNVLESEKCPSRIALGARGGVGG